MENNRLGGASGKIAILKDFFDHEIRVNDADKWSEVLRQVPKFKASMLDYLFPLSYDQSMCKSFPDTLMDSIARDLRCKIQAEHPEMLEKEISITFEDHFAENGQLIRTFTVAEKKEIRQS